MSEYQFNRAIHKSLDDLPDHYLQEINDLCGSILLNVTIDKKSGLQRDSNIALGAMQKALGLLIGKFFQPQDMGIVLDQVCAALRLNSKLWSQDE
jgi:hypothetical protein